MRKISLRLLSVLTLGVLVLAGCGGSAGKTVPAAPAAPAAPAKPASGQRQQVALGATQQSSSAYAFYVALASVINNNVPEINATAVESGASVDNIRQMADGRLHLGLVTEDTAYQASAGIDPFTAKDNTLRTLMVYDMGPQFYAVADNSPVKSLADLSGKKYSPGFSGSATETITKMLFKDLNITPNYFTGSLDTIIDAVQNNQIIGFGKGGAMKSLDASLLQIAATKPLRILSFSAADKEALAKNYPYITWVTIPASVMQGKGIVGPGGDVTTWAVVITVSTTSKMSQDLGYKIFKAAAEHKADLEKAYARSKDFDFTKDSLQYSTVPLHAGVVQYLKEKGVNVPANLIPPEYKS